MARLKDLGQLKQSLDLQKRQAEQAAAAAEAARQAKAAEQALMQRAAGVKTSTRHSDENSPFSELMRDVRPLKAAVSPPKKAQPAKPDAATLARRAAAQGGEGVEIAGISDMQALMNPVAAEAALSWKDQTIPYRIFDQLKQGQLRWYQAVDLHGCTIEQARQAVLEVIHMAQAEQQNTVKIVHGKGEGGLLKTCVNGWLRQHPQVLAFHSAPVAQGGTGAVLVLLKRHSGE